MDQPSSQLVYELVSDWVRSALQAGAGISSCATSKPLKKKNLNFKQSLMSQKTTKLEENGPSPEKSYAESSVTIGRKGQLGINELYHLGSILTLLVPMQR